MRPLSRSIALGFTFGLLFAVTHCSSSDASSPAAPVVTAPASKVVGASGGSISSADGNVDLVIPAGALASDVTITIQPATSPGTGSIGTVYDFGPDGTKFLNPITMTFHYGGFDLRGHNAKELRVATFIDGAWVPWTGTALDEAAQKVSAQVTHFSPGALIAPSEQKICLPVASRFGCNASGTGAGGGGCTKPPEATCAGGGAAACARYPGSSLEGCTDSDQGFDGACCYPAGQPVCVLSSAPGCNGDGGGTGCPPPPTCASNPSCPADTTLKSCADGSAGYQATCCYAAGVVPPASSGGGTNNGGTDAGGGNRGGDTDAGSSSPPDGGQ